jgi:hypothetical protein
LREEKKLSYHPLEERHVQIVICGKLVDVRIGAKLLVITNQNQMLTSGTQRCDDVRLQYLSGFLYYGYARSYFLDELTILCSSC